MKSIELQEKKLEDRRKRLVSDKEKLDHDQDVSLERNNCWIELKSHFNYTVLFSILFDDLFLQEKIVLSLLLPILMMHTFYKDVKHIFK